MMIEIWIAAFILGLSAGWMFTALYYYWTGESIEDRFQAMHRDLVKRADGATDQVVGLLNELDQSLAENRNLREELAFMRQMEAQQRHLAQLMHSRTSLPSWADLRRSEDEIGARLREIDESIHNHAMDRQSQNAE